MTSQRIFKHQFGISEQSSIRFRSQIQDPSGTVRFADTLGKADDLWAIAHHLGRKWTILGGRKRMIQRDDADDTKYYFWISKFETYLGQNSTVLKYRSVSQSGRSYKKKDPKPWLNGSIFMSSFQKYCVIDDVILSHYDVTVKVTNIIIWLISALRNDDIMSKLSSDDDVTWFDMSHIIWVITWPV